MLLNIWASTVPQNKPYSTLIKKGKTGNQRICKSFTTKIFHSGLKQGSFVLPSAVAHNKDEASGEA